MKIIITMMLFVLYSLAHAATPVEQNGALKVQGNKIIGSHGETVMMAGNSLFWSNDTYGGEAFYNRNVVEYLDEEWDASIIRIAMGVEDYGGYIGSPANNLQRAKTIIDLAIEKGLYVIVDWHSHNAEDYEDQAVDFFTQIAREYGDKPNIIYEVYNEPIHQDWSSEIKPYAEAVIRAIRAQNSDNLVIVGSSTWSQDVDIASSNPITMDDNVAYTLHFYAGTHFDSLRNKAQTALNNGVALFCTEWGTVNADGNGGVNEANTREWIEFLRENAISHCNWAVNNKAEGASVFLPNTSPTANFNDTHLTDSGKLVKEIVLAWALDGEPVDNNTNFTPDPNKTYYIDVPVHNLRLAANGESEDPYMTATSTSGADVEWKFVAKGNGSWHIRRAAGGSVPGLRSRNNGQADMQATSSSGSWTYYDFAPGNSVGTYYMTLPDHTASYQRVQVEPSGKINYVTTGLTGNWVSFKFTEVAQVSTGPQVVVLKKSNATNFVIDGDFGGSNGQNVHLWTYIPGNENQEWEEIDRGGGFYSYQKRGTNFSLDGGRTGANGQNIYLWKTGANNYNQHWQKVSTGGNAFKLIKRNASGFAINGGSGGADFQNVNLFNSSNTSQNLQWIVEIVD